jgi:demethylmenaquinone methyltransferase/2-methoxy-6-polyprenyl-1,4-benzoquinol methylase
MVAELAPTSRKKYLDVAGGSGDIGFKVWEKGAHVTLTDINPDMLQVARDKAVDNGIIERIEFAEMNAEKMPYADESFDIAGIAFGIRNVTNIDVALKEFFRVLKKGGKFVCLEFSQVDNEFLAKAYDAYSFNVIPKVGGLVAGDEASYQYLVESIRKFPKAAEFENMIAEAGFGNTKHRKLTFGTVAIHVGVKN